MMPTLADPTHFLRTSYPTPRTNIEGVLFALCPSGSLTLDDVEVHELYPDIRTFETYVDVVDDHLVATHTPLPLFVLTDGSLVAANILDEGTDYPILVYSRLD